MINKKTVFILGAGASAPYGYPKTGVELATIICDNLNDFELYRIEERHERSVRFDIFKQLGVEKEKLLEFRRELLGLKGDSIDSFLEYRKEYRKIGKLAIAEVLISCEKKNNLEGDWYQFLFSKMTEHAANGLDDFIKNQIIFVTFNYDRSLRQYLYRSIKSKYGDSNVEKIRQFVKDKIIHVYGTLDHLEWESNNSRTYGEGFCPGQLEGISENIKIIHDGVNKDDPNLQKAINHIKEAETIYFLGFGYHENNLNLLELKQDYYQQKASLDGTAFGLDERDRKRRDVKKYFRHRIQLRESDTDVLRFLRYYANVF